MAKKPTLHERLDRVEAQLVTWNERQEEWGSHIYAAQKKIDRWQREGLAKEAARFAEEIREQVASDLRDDGEMRGIKETIWQAVQYEDASSKKAIDTLRDNISTLSSQVLDLHGLLSSQVLRPQSKPYYPFSRLFARWMP